MIFGPRSTYVGKVWLGTVLVQDIWSGLASVEDIDYQPRSREGDELVAT